MKSSPGSVHPLVSLDRVVRLIACPIPALFVITSRISAGEAMPAGVWIALAFYAVVWPHVAYLIGRRAENPRAVEVWLLVVDAAAAGAAIALVSFRTIPTIVLLTGYASALASVGGLVLLVVGVAVLIGGALLVGALFTGFAFAAGTPLLTAALGIASLLVFQTMMALLTYRTARSFVASRQRVAQQAAEINAQNEALVEAREEALQAARAKAAFLATMSHEIRTPLNGVLGMARLLEETPHTTEQAELLRTIRVSGDTLLTVVNDILDYSRIESGRMELEEEPLRVREVVEEAFEIVAEKARAKGLELVCDVAGEVPSAIVGDSTRLRQIVTNLVGNAVKFTERGEVVVRVRLEAPQSDTQQAVIAFEVADTGIGIPADRIGDLFTPFSQADASTTRRYGGSGLGLAICRRLTELMGGTISAESEPGEGTTIRFTIRAAITSGPPGAPDQPTELAVGKRVLIVDDNETNRRVLAAQLEQWGLETVAADGADRALEVLSEGADPDLAILDLHMPEVDGIELARRIRRLPRFRDLPLILLSSSLVLTRDDPEGLFTARLVKPARQSGLFDAVMTTLGARVRERPTAATEPILLPIAEASPLRILVADDNQINRQVAGLVLGRLGYDVEHAVDGRDAVDHVVHHATASEHVPFDLVLMDVHMPGMDGLEATRAIRRLAEEQPGTRWPRVVAMTANAMPEDRQRCLDAGMDDYLTKPLDFHAVRKVLQETAELVGATERTAAPARPAEPAPDRVPGSIAADSDDGAAIDWSRLDELRSYDTPDGAVVAAAVSAFVDQTPTRLEEVRRAVAGRDAGDLRHSAHALKGAATNVGAVAVADWATRLERAGADGALDGAERLVDNLAMAVVQTLVELHHGADRASGGR